MTGGVNNDIIVDPLLGPLRDNGSFTQTHAPLSARRVRLVTEYRPTIYIESAWEPGRRY